MNSSGRLFAQRFQDWHPIGSGAEGRLYRVQDTWVNQSVALKVAESEVDRHALVGEFLLLSTLRHPCLIRSFDLVYLGDACGHVLEYLPAEDPRSLMERGGEPAVWAALTQSLRALTYLHRRGYMHCDVSPGNILVWSDGGKWYAKVADLGLTLKTDEASVAGIRGTPGYVAPEVSLQARVGPASDLYGLAATAIAWIDGEGPWDSLPPSERLKRPTTERDNLRPKRRVSPELERLIGLLGSFYPENRSIPDFADLNTENAWGPPILKGTIVGIEDALSELSEHGRHVLPGQVEAIVIKGAPGSGRRTLCRALTRRLVAESWIGLFELPVNVMKTWLSTDVIDPVLVAREMLRRFEGLDVVVRLPDRLGTLRSRVLKAFLAGRNGEERSGKTLLLGTAGPEPLSGDHRRFLYTYSCLEYSWRGLNETALKSLQEDLFAADNQALEARGIDSPLAIELEKRGRVQGHGSDYTHDLAEQAFRRVVEAVWAKSSTDVRDAISVLSLGEAPWHVEDLSGLLGWDLQRANGVADSLILTTLFRSSFDAKGRIVQVSDSLARRYLRDCADGHISENRRSELCEWIDSNETLEGDTRLLASLLNSGCVPARYLHRTLEESLSLGRNDEVLDLEPLINSVEMKKASRKRCYEYLLLAARTLGRYAKEAELLGRLLEVAPDRQVIEYRMRLSSVLASLGNWGEAIGQCEEIDKDQRATEAESLLSTLQRAEILWQSGDFHKADTVYEVVKGLLRDDMQKEWLRYGVSRAREFGQRGDMDQVAAYLEEARARAGTALCESDVMFLITKGGLDVELGNHGAAAPIMERALEVALQEGNWNAHVMAAHRACTIEYGLGRMWEASRVGREGITTAVALGSKRIERMISSTTAFPEVILGNLGASLKCSQEMISTAEELGDVNLLIQAHRLRAFVGAYGGWRELVERSSRAVEGVGREIGADEALSFLDYCAGLFFYGEHAWKEASDRFESALVGARETGQAGHVLKIRTLMTVVNSKLGRSENDNTLEEIESELRLGRNPALEPMVSLARALDSRSISEADWIEALDQMWDHGRLMEFLEWAPSIAGIVGKQGPINLRKRIVNIVQRAANSLDDTELRKQFLSSKRVRFALLTARG